MPDLVALALPGGPSFVAALQRAWERGDAVLPVDLRLPGPARARLLETMGATRLVTDAGETVLPTAVPADGHPATDPADGHPATDPAGGHPPIEPGDALVMATSGTTGTPKGVVLTHDAITAAARATSDRIGVTAHDTWLACLPLAHVGGLSVVTRALVTGTALIVHDGFDAARAQAAEASLVSLVATALARIDPARFRVIVLGGARPPTDLPPNVVTTYGMTETGGGVVYDGRPLDGVEVAVDATGGIRLRGPMLLRAYRDGSRPLDADGWLATGDIGRLLADGRLEVDGRRGDLIITGGENVWPDPVEARLRAHPGVIDVAVAGRADPAWGQRVVAFVVPAPAGPPTLDALRGWVKDELPPYCAPHQLVLVDTIPRTALGKVRRDLLPATDPR